MNSAPDAVRVIVADDEAFVRAGLVSILATDPQVVVVAEAGNGSDAATATRAHRPDVVLLDIRMPRGSGLEVLAELRREHDRTPCVFVTTFGEDDYLLEALRLGADGFVLKSGDPRELLLAVQAASRGGAFFSPALARRVLTASRIADFDRAHQARARIQGLTPRERDVLRLVGAGLSNTEIADQLFLTEGTVKGHVSAILRTTRSRNRVEAALLGAYAEDS